MNLPRKYLALKAVVTASNTVKEWAESQQYAAFVEGVHEVSQFPYHLPYLPDYYPYLVSLTDRG